MDGRRLIVVENKKTDERFLYNPFKYKKVVPDGFYKVTSRVPLNESKFGHLPVMEGIENKNPHNLLEENIYKQFSISLEQNKKEEVEKPTFREWFEEQTAIGGLKIERK